MQRETASVHVIMLNAGAIADITERTVNRNKRKLLPPLAKFCDARQDNFRNPKSQRPSAKADQLFFRNSAINNQLGLVGFG
jgi:hypothetical protein